MNLMKIYLLIATTLLLSACAVPDSTVKTGSVRPTLLIKGAPADATLLVDGLVMGPASQFNGEPNTLLIEEGVHQVQIKQGNTIIHSEKAAVSNGESRTITINAGVQ
jgi:hypothetical protein